MRMWGAAAAVVFGLATAAQAGPLDLKQVSADAQWVAHLDVDAMRTSTLVRKAYERAVEQFPGAEQHLASLREHVGIDPTQDLHSITVYGKQLGPHEGVLILQAESDQKVLLRLAEKAPGHQVTKYGAYDVHSSTLHKKGVAAAFFKPAVLVFGSSVDEVKAALDVLEGKKPALAGKRSLLAAGTPAGTILVARATGLSEALLPFKSPVVTQCETFSLATGENDGQSFLQASLATKTPQTAQRMKSIVDGIRAMVLLQFGDNADVTKMIDHLKTNVTDKTVNVEFRAPADEVWAMGEKIANLVRHHGHHGAKKHAK
jgi:hypothetical protein